MCQLENPHIMFFTERCTEASWHRDIAVKMQSGPL